MKPLQLLIAAFAMLSFVVGGLSLGAYRSVSIAQVLPTPKFTPRTATPLPLLINPGLLLPSPTDFSISGDPDSCKRSIDGNDVYDSQCQRDVSNGTSYVLLWTWKYEAYGTVADFGLFNAGDDTKPVLLLFNFNDETKEDTCGITGNAPDCADSRMAWVPKVNVPQGGCLTLRAVHRTGGGSSWHDTYTAESNKVCFPHFAPKLF